MTLAGAQVLSDAKPKPNLNTNLGMESTQKLLKLDVLVLL